jgi:hypothetical protein
MVVLLVLLPLPSTGRILGIRILQTREKRRSIRSNSVDSRRHCLCQFFQIFLRRSSNVDGQIVASIICVAKALISIVKVCTGDGRRAGKLGQSRLRFGIVFFFATKIVVGGDGFGRGKTAFILLLLLLLGLSKKKKNR